VKDNPGRDPQVILVLPAISTFRKFGLKKIYLQWPQRKTATQANVNSSPAAQAKESCEPVVS
jgi:hypothetical protein